MDNPFLAAAILNSIPKDRIALVKRNVELKMKLDERGKIITEIQLAIHQAHEHMEPFDTCLRTTCESVRKLLELTKAS